MKKALNAAATAKQGKGKISTIIIALGREESQVYDLDALYERESELEEIVRALKAAERMHIDPEDAEFELELCRGEIRAAMQAEEDAMCQAYERSVM